MTRYSVARRGLRQYTHENLWPRASIRIGASNIATARQHDATSRNASAFDAYLISRQRIGSTWLGRRGQLALRMMRVKHVEGMAFDGRA